MQILHISDTHLGHAQFNLEERERDVYEALDEALDAAISEHVNCVVHAGDIFDSPRPGGRPMLRLLEGLKRLKERNIGFYFTLGNHDIARLRQQPVALLYERVGLARYVERDPPIVHEGLVLLGFHEHRPSELEELEEKLKKAELLARDLKGKKVLVLHQTLREAHPYAGKLSSEKLPAGFDYYAMGDLHYRWERHFSGLSGPVCYPGSIDVLSLEPGLEAAEALEKGYYLVDLSGDEASPRWVRLRSTRPVRLHEIPYERLEQALEGLLAEAAKMSKKPVIKLRIRGKDINVQQLERRLAKLREGALYLDYDIIEERERALLASAPDIRSETFRLAVQVLGDEAKARLAIQELLPRLAEGRKDEAVELLWRLIERKEMP
jgi:DNA repair exonuclease SbcCD nuclease subunit